jgi:hypothetical protein
MPTPPPMPARKSPAPPPKAPVQQTHQAPRATKSFGVEDWTGHGEGEKIIIYAASGKGKTTLASMAPAPLYIGLDDGGRKIRNPITGEAVKHVTGVETFADVLDVLRQPTLLSGCKSVVIDTGTILEMLAIQWVCENVPHEKSGTVVKSIEDYGYGKGYIHLFDAMKTFFATCDGVIRQGKNVIMLCQQCPIVIANAAGTNYLQDGPKLWAPGPESKQSFTIRGFACEWADHVLKLDYLTQNVIGGGVAESFGKKVDKAGKAVGDTTRAIFTMPTNPSYFAKTRTLTEPVISFATASDDSLWRFLYPGEYGQ